MGHYNVYQICTEPVDKDKYISEDTFIYDDNWSDWADYFSDMEEYEQEEAIKYLPKLLNGLFSINGREMVFLGGDSFMEEWLSKIHETSDKLTLNEFKNDYLSTWDLRKITEYTHKYVWDRFYGLEGDFASTFGDFVWTVCKRLKPGDKLYIGGVVDFHF